MITSTKNNFIKQVRKLHLKKERQKSNKFLVEGFHLIEEAINSEWEIENIIVTDKVSVPNWCHDLPITYVSDHVFNYVSQTETPQGIAAVITMKNIDIKSNEKMLLIDAIQDPGNLGTIIRTADAAGFNHIILGKGTVDLYNDKVIRATQGSMFHVKIEQNNLSDTIESIQEKGFTVYASALENAISYKDMTPKDKIALVLGNEGAGISEEVLQQADERIHIPILGKAESLNVGVAAGILMYKFV